MEMRGSKGTLCEFDGAKYAACQLKCFGADVEKSGTTTGNRLDSISWSLLIAERSKMMQPIEAENQQPDSVAPRTKGGRFVIGLGLVAFLLWLAWPWLAMLILGFWTKYVGKLPNDQLGPFGDLFGSLAAVFVVGAFLLALYGVILERRQLARSEQSRELEQQARLESDIANKEAAKASQDVAKSSLELVKSTVKLSEAFAASSSAAEQSARASVALLTQVREEKQLSSDTATALRDAASASSVEIQRAMKAASAATDSQLQMAKQLNAAAEKILAGYAEGERLRTESQRIYKEIIDAQKQTTIAMSNLYNAQLQDLKVAQFFRRLEYLRDAINALQGTDLNGKLAIGVEFSDVVWERIEQEVNKKRTIPVNGGSSRSQPDREQLQAREKHLRSTLPAALVKLDPIDSVTELVVALAEWINATCDSNSLTDDATKTHRSSMRVEFGHHLAVTVPDKLRALILYSAFAGRLKESRAKACHEAGLFPTDNAAARIDFFDNLDRFIVPVNAGT
jgi:hypothetical protein